MVFVERKRKRKRIFIYTQGVVVVIVIVTKATVTTHHWQPRQQLISEFQEASRFKRVIKTRRLHPSSIFIKCHCYGYATYMYVVLVRGTWYVQGSATNRTHFVLVLGLLFFRTHSLCFAVLYFISHLYYYQLFYLYIYEQLEFLYKYYCCVKFLSIF